MINGEYIFPNIFISLNNFSIFSVPKHKIIFCSICEFEHEIKKIVKVDETNEEDTCSII